MSNAVEIFQVMNDAVVDAGASLVQKVNGSIKFDVKGAGIWLIDLKKNASVKKSDANEKADLTITISEADFIDLIHEKLNPQTAFMKGKIKVKGNMGLAMKLGAVTKATKAFISKKGVSESAPTAAASTSTSPSGLKSAAFFAQVGEAVKADGATLVSKVKGIIQFNITPGNTFFYLSKNFFAKYPSI